MADIKAPIPMYPSSVAQMTGKAAIVRNLPRAIQIVRHSSSFVSKHANFKATESTRPNFERDIPIRTTKTPSPEWKYGDGVRIPEHDYTEIDPYASDRSYISNYKLLIAGIPRPISFISTISQSGQTNLAPFSYVQVVDHDPPIFVVGFSARKDRLKDTRRNLTETGECVISVVSEHMIEAVNATSLELPHGISEWDLSGLTSAPSSTVRPQRVKDAIFSVEGKLLEMKPLDYGKLPDSPHGALAIIKGTRFWVRSDATNPTRDDVALDKLRPLVQLGGISYGRIIETFELPRPGLKNELQDKLKGLDKYVDLNKLQGGQEEAPEVVAKMAAS